MSPVFRHGGLRLYLLGLLEEAPRHGYEVIVELENRFLGTYAPSAGTVYPRLAKLEDEGLVRHDEVDGRKVYSLTEAGRADLDAHRDELASVERDISASVARVASDVRRDVGAEAADLRAALTNAARTGRRERRASARREREEPGPRDDHDGRRALERELTELVREAGRALAHATPDQVERALEVARRARRDLAAVLG